MVWDKGQGDKATVTGNFVYLYLHYYYLCQEQNAATAVRVLPVHLSTYMIHRTSYIHYTSTSHPHHVRGPWHAASAARPCMSRRCGPDSAIERAKGPTCLFCLQWTPRAECREQPATRPTTHVGVGKGGGMFLLMTVRLIGVGDKSTGLTRVRSEFG